MKRSGVTWLRYGAWALAVWIAAGTGGCGGDSGSKSSGRPAAAPSASVKKALAEGKDYLTDGKRKQAIAAYSRAIKGDPKCKEAYLWRAIAYKENGNAKAALADLNKVIQLDPKDSYAYEQRADLYEKKFHDSAKAKADRDRAFELRQKNRDEMRTRLKGKKKPDR